MGINSKRILHLTLMIGAGACLFAFTTIKAKGVGINVKYFDLSWIWIGIVIACIIATNRMHKRLSVRKKIGLYISVFIFTTLYGGILILLDKLGYQSIPHLLITEFIHMMCVSIFILLVVNEKVVLPYLLRKKEKGQGRKGRKGSDLEY